MILVQGGLVVTMDAGRRVLADGGVLIDGDRIRRVGPVADLAAEPGIARTIDAGRHLILPGLINAHNHCFQTLYRGLGRDRALADWSGQVILPLSRWLGRDEARAAARLACLEMVTGGTTAFVDSHYVHHDPRTFDAVAEAVVESGLRALLARAVMDAAVVPEPLREDVPTALRESERVIARWHGAGGGRVRVRPEALSERTTSPALIEAMVRAGRQAKTGFNMHLAESQQGARHLREVSGRSPGEFLESIGAVGPDVLLAHCVWLDDGDVETLARTGTRVAHNPVSNQYLMTGVAPVPRMLARGVAVGLGTDGAASNNNLDMLGVMKACGLLHRKTTGAIPAEAVVAMATTGGATALDWAADIGSLEAGKKADLVVLSLDRPELTPLHDPFESLVYSATAAAVDTVIVDGRVLMDGRRVLTLDADAVVADARAAASRLVARWRGATP
jgi:5-methylthioadenosine/S-adenosylhomocysteine deaminase